MLPSLYKMLALELNIYNDWIEQYYFGLLSMIGLYINQPQHPNLNL